MEYKNFRVKSLIRSFRDLEVYQKTIQLSEELTSLKFIKKQEISSLTEKVPKLIAEAYGDRFDSRELAHNKLTEAITLIANIITKIDLFRQRAADNKEHKEVLDKFLTKYQTQKRKILNLRKAWDRVFRGRKWRKTIYLYKATPKY